MEATGRVTLRNAAGDAAVIGLYGGQLLSWRTAHHGEQLYLSPWPTAPGKPVRGGVPVCFPQFAERGPLPKHGYARTSVWALARASAQPEPVASAVLRLAPALELEVRLGDGWIELYLRATNTDRAPLTFTAALHTYFAVPDVRQASVHGLQSTGYEDALDGFALKREQAAAVTFDGELDRVYHAVPGPLELLAPGAPRRRIAQEGFTDVVVWNPGPEKAARLGDMPPQDWARMVCVEAGAIAAPITLQAGDRWVGMQRCSIERD